MIPTTTGAATAVGLVLPRAQGQARRHRHPRADRQRLGGGPHGRSWASRPRVQAVNDAFREAAAGQLKGILDATDEELVSVDFNGNPHSSIVDLPSTALVDGNLVKVLAWYDNEWGYSSRVRDLIRYIGKIAVAEPRRSCPSSRWTSAGRRVFLRADFNVPLEGGAGHRRHAAHRGAADHPALRSSAAPPSCSPRTSAVPRAGPIRSTRSAPVAERLARAARPAGAAGPRLRGRRRSEALARALKPGEVLLLENLRFHPEEEANDDALRAARSPRWPTSTSTTPSRPRTAPTPRSRPSRATCSRPRPACSCARELEALGRILERPGAPAGRRAGRRQGLRQDRAGRAPARRRSTRSLIGGGMAFTFLRALGHGVGRVAASSPTASRRRAPTLEAARAPRRADRAAGRRRGGGRASTARRAARCRSARSRPSRWGSTSAR